MGHMEEFASAPRPFLRIAVPAWRVGVSVWEKPKPEKAISPDECKHLYRSGLRPPDPLHLRLTPAERAQMRRAARVRAALYGRSGPA